MSFDDKTSPKVSAVKFTVAMLVPSLLSADSQYITMIPQRVFHPAHGGALSALERLIRLD
jgi:hypothetical protein